MKNKIAITQRGIIPGIHRKTSQSGSVLLWGLVILLTLTVIGVAAARMGVTELHIAGNQVFGAMTYQSAESSLERSSTDLYYINEAEKADDHLMTWPFTDQVQGGETNSIVTVRMGGSIMCTGHEGLGMSAEMLADVGRASCRLFTMDAQARLSGTGAKSVHSLGVSKLVPATGDELPDVNGS